MLTESSVDSPRPRSVSSWSGRQTPTYTVSPESGSVEPENDSSAMARSPTGKR